MCTVIVNVPEDHTDAARVLAIRDEDPDRPWNPLGEHWPTTHPGVQGVQDARAGGAWLATLPPAGRLAVLLNVGGPTPAPGLASRGEVVLDAVAGREPDASRRTQPYNLVTVQGARVRLSLSDGETITQQVLDPGVHMLVNSELPNDESFTRVVRWLPEFRRAAPGGSGEGPEWFAPWLEVLHRSQQLPPTDDAAIIRDNRPWGIPTMSLLVCTASIRDGGAEVSYRELEHPDLWRGGRYSAATTPEQGGREGREGEG